MEELEIVKQIILQTDNDELLRQIILAAVKRWGAMFPDWEIMIVSSPKDDPQAKRDLIEYAFRMIEMETEENTRCIWKEEARKAIKVKN